VSAREAAALLPELTRIAREAGELIMQGYRRGAETTKISKKGAIDLVTEFDLAAESHIVAELARSCPELIVIGEEGKGQRLPSRDADGLVCFVDPIDGTTNFAHGHPFFCVSLGICRGGAPLAGVVLAPALGVTWTGALGQGATRNGEPCGVSHTGQLSEALCATGFGYQVVGAEDDNLREFASVQNRTRGVRRCGAAAMDLALVADGTYDAYWEFMLQPWDMAAGCALVLAAGGVVTSFDQGAPDVRSGACLASNGRVHAELAALLHGARGGRPVPTR
jgi:myo-inositol-1(or 4)-monophosphatase